MSEQLDSLIDLFFEKDQLTDEQRQALKREIQSVMSPVVFLLALSQTFRVAKAWMQLQNERSRGNKQSRPTSRKHRSRNN